MTKQQAIKALIKMGCTEIVPSGKFSIWATIPAGIAGISSEQRGLFDPRDLLIELVSRTAR